MTIPIVEIFNSIEGEGVRAGKLCTFIRTAGCNLRCSYCDTTYSHDVSSATQMTLKEIIDKVEELDCPLVTITGGEPLINPEVTVSLIPWLLEKGFDINIETNGSVDINKVTRHRHDKLMFTVDWKSPSSGMNNHMLTTNPTTMKPKDVLKFVVGSQEDLEEMLRVIQDKLIVAQIFVSPVFGQIELSDIVDFLKQHKLYNVRLQVQLHKIIWDPSERGV